jgi:transporter family protein
MPAWIALSLFAALLLGLYELSKKHAVRGNAVLPVLFFSNLTAASIWVSLLFLQPVLPLFLQVEVPDLTGHLFLAGKAILVGTSWIFAYFAVKHLPVSIVGPIRSTAPLWTLVGALVLFAETPAPLQWVGICLTLGSFIAFSLAGRREGIHFRSNKWVAFIILATLMGGASSLYDRFLLTDAGLSPATVQAGFSFYLVAFFAPFALGWKLRLWKRDTFTWRWSIPAIGLGLLATDFAYFTALSSPEAMVAIVSSIRRASVLVVFAGGYLLYKEGNMRAKLPPTLGILLGVTLLVLGS